MCLCTSQLRRRAFTLIEMLVVVVLMLILMTIAAAMFPRFAENQRVIKGADQVSSMLLNAKMRALRDRRATGVRLLLDQGVVRELVYVQQVDDYAVGHYRGEEVLPLQPPLGYPCTFRGVDFAGDGSATLEAPDRAPVVAGDYIEFLGGGLVHEIWWVRNPTALYLHPASSPPPRVPTPLPGSAPNYRIIRQPRPVAGEPSLQLPQNIAVDGVRSQNVPVRRVYVGTPSAWVPSNPDSRTNVKFFEILFAPGGGVVGKGTSTGENIILWVRDVTKDDATMEGSPLLVSVHTRTGMIAVHPVNTGGPDPYSFTKDGRSSGL